MTTVGIIGGSGFIGSHVTRTFLDRGYDVKVGVTAIKNSKKYRHLFNFAKSDNLNICQLRVEDKSELTDFVKNCTIVVHCGTPFKLDVENPRAEIFRPTVDGTDNLLAAVAGEHGVRRVVLVASVAAWNTDFPMPPAGKDATDPIDEHSIRYHNPESHPYALAKFEANQRVMEFVQSRSAPDLEVVSVSPVAVVGRALSKRDDSTSQVLQHIVKNRLSPSTFFQNLWEGDVVWALVDVRDVADAIFKAAEVPGVHGRDFLLSSQSYRMSDMCELLNGREPKEKPTVVYKNDLARTELGVRFRPIAETLNSYGQSALNEEIH